MGYRDSIKSVLKELTISYGSILVTGATGLIGSCIIDILLEANKNGAKFKIYAMSRSEEKITNRFSGKVIPFIQDVILPIKSDNDFDFIIDSFDWTICIGSC